jgi:hypothetical protein
VAAFIAIETPGGGLAHTVWIDGSEREVTDILFRIHEEFQARGGAWISSGDGTDQAQTVWVPNSSTIRTNLGATDLPSTLATIEVQTLTVGDHQASRGGRG